MSTRPAPARSESWMFAQSGRWERFDLAGDAPQHRSMLDYITARNLISGRLVGPWADDWADVEEAGGLDVEAYLDWAMDAEAEGSPSSPYDYLAWMTPGDWDIEAAGSWYVGRHRAEVDA